MLLFAVVGRPVAHSLSPQMHRAAFRALGIEAEYVRMDCAEEELPGIAELLRRGALAGVNLTVPHKAAAFRLADEAAGDARTLLSANTWVRDGDRVVAHSTDGDGFLRGLPTGLKRPKRALILGAGGAARAICLALSGAGWEVTVAARSPEKAAGVFEPLGGRLTSWDVAGLAPSLGLLVNATPLGMEPDVESGPDFPLGNLRRDCVVYDIVYKPRETVFLRRAAALGLTTVAGVAMLAGQGARSLELWLGRPAPEAAMLTAVEEALG